MIWMYVPLLPRSGGRAAWQHPAAPVTAALDAWYQHKPPTNGKRQQRSNGWHETFLEALAEHGTVGMACKTAGISRSTAYQHRRDDPDFALRWNDAIEHSTDLLEEAYYRRATERSDRAAEFILKARKPEVYQEAFKVAQAIRRELEHFLDQLRQNLSAEDYRRVLTAVDNQRALTGD